MLPETKSPSGCTMAEIGAHPNGTRVAVASRIRWLVREDLNGPTSGSPPTLASSTRSLARPGGAQGSVRFFAGPSPRVGRSVVSSVLADREVEAVSCYRTKFRHLARRGR